MLALYGTYIARPRISQLTGISKVQPIDMLLLSCFCAGFHPFTYRKALNERHFSCIEEFATSYCWFPLHWPLRFPQLFGFMWILTHSGDLSLACGDGCLCAWLRSRLQPQTDSLQLHLHAAGTAVVFLDSDGLKSDDLIM